MPILSKVQIHRFFDDKFVVGIEDQCDVVFDRGTAIIPVPRSDVVQKIRDFDGFCYVDVGLSDYILPRLDMELWGTASPTYTRYRMSRTGPSF